MDALAPAFCLIPEFEGIVCIAAVVVLVSVLAATRRPARQCPRCGEINREAALYCAQCGLRLPQR